MASLNDLYRSINQQLEAIQQADRVEKEQQRRTAEDSRAAAAKQITQLDAELQTLLSYQGVAAAYVPKDAIQATYPPTPVDPGYLSSLYNNSSDWMTIYRTASAGIAWLEQEKRRLQASPVRPSAAQISHTSDNQCRQILQSQNAAELKRQLAELDDYYAPMKIIQRGYHVPATDTLPPFGKVGEPFPVTDGCVMLAKQIFGDGFDQSNRTLLRHSIFPNVTLIQANTSMMNNVLRYMRAYALSFICHTIPAQQKVFFIDACTLDPSSLGFLQNLTQQGDSIIASVPESMAAAQARLSDLRQLQTSAAAHRLLIFRYRPHSSDHGCAEKLQWLCSNAATYHLQVIMVQELPDAESDYAKFRPNYLPADARIFTSPSRQYLETAVEHRRLFWYLEPDSIPQSFINALVKAYQPPALETRYFKVNPIPQKLPYTRDRRRRLSLLYGVGQSGKKYYLDLGGMDFSAYIVGASGSGKSTLLNVLITSAILNFHPDDLEMWLVDFGRSEFSRYTKHTPPHVRYILIEKTTELVCSLVLKLREEIDRRGRILTKYDVLKITDLPENLPKEDHMPRLLVIIDEFGAFNSILADPNFPDKQVFKSHLEYLLLQGRKHGMHFIFSNQFFIDISKALSDDAKNQIGLRVSMLANTNEMKAVLALPAGEMTDAETNRINRLPQRQALFTCRSNPGVLSEPVHVLYFDKDQDEPARMQLIDNICRMMKPTAQNRQSPNDTYLAHPQFFLDRDAVPKLQDRTAQIQADIKAWQQNPAWQPSDLLLYLGEPRNMDPIHHELLRNTRDHNLLLYGNYARNLTGLASVLYSIDQSARMQGVPVEYWCDEHDVLANRFISQWAVHGSMLRDRNKLLARAEELDEQWNSRTLKPRVIIVTGFAEILSALEDDKAENARRNRSSSKTEELNLDTIRSMVGDMRLLQLQTPVPVQPSSYDLQTNINDLLNLLPRYGVHFVFVVQSESELLASKIASDHFSHLAGFASGVHDCMFSSFRNRITDISENEMCGCLTNGLFTVYMPFSDLKT